MFKKEEVDSESERKHSTRLIWDPHLYRGINRVGKFRGMSHKKKNKQQRCRKAKPDRTSALVMPMDVALSGQKWY